MKKSSMELIQKLVIVFILFIIICSLAYMFRTYYPIRENLTVCKNGSECKNCDNDYKSCLDYYIGDSGYLPDYIPYMIQDY
jgi:hypothetical protein